MWLIWGNINILPKSQHVLFEPTTGTVEKPNKEESNKPGRRVDFTSTRPSCCNKYAPNLVA